jgi:hypothetical protein
MEKVDMLAVLTVFFVQKFKFTNLMSFHTKNYRIYKMQMRKRDNPVERAKSNTEHSEKPATTIQDLLEIFIAFGTVRDFISFRRQSRSSLSSAAAAFVGNI